MTQKQGTLLDPKEERFAKLVADGMKPGKAKRAAGFNKNPTLRALMESETIKRRIETIKQQIAHRAELSYQGIIDRVDEDGRLASMAGQYSAALKASEMLGGELHNMFTKKLEVGRAGEFDNMTEQELRDFITSEMKEVGALVESGQPIIQIDSKPNEPTQDGENGENGELPAKHETENS